MAHIDKYAYLNRKIDNVTHELGNVLSSLVATSIRLQPSRPVRNGAGGQPRETSGIRWVAVFVFLTAPGRIRDGL